MRERNKERKKKKLLAQIDLVSYDNNACGFNCDIFHVNLIYIYVNFP